MNKKELINDLITRGEQLRSTFESSGEHTRIKTSKDPRNLSKWVNECIITIKSLNFLGESSEVYKQFESKYKSITNITERDFDILLGAMDAIISKYDDILEDYEGSEAGLF